MEVVFEKHDSYDENMGGEKVGQYRHGIGFRKHEGKWRLCFMKYYADYIGPQNSDPIIWKPIVECMVEDRVCAAPHIGLLREEIVKSKEDFVPKVEQAIYELEQALSIYDE